MKLKTVLLLMLSFGVCSGVYAQVNKEDKEDKAEKREETKARVKDKTDYNLFHRQMLSLKEFSDERRKIPALQKANKTPVKVLAVVDTSDDNTNSKTLTGYIVQNIGDNTANIYEVTFDRAAKKITEIKHTPEAVAADKEDKAEETKPAEKKAGKKKKDDDDDGDDDDDKPAKGKDKDEDKD